MSFASRHNKGNKFDVNFDGFEEKKLNVLFAEDPEAIHTVKAVYISKKGKYGASPFVVCDGYCVYLPQHMVDEINEILSSDEDVAAIKAGTVGFTVYEYEIPEDYPGKKFYSINWEDI